MKRNNHNDYKNVILIDDLRSVVSDEKQCVLVLFRLFENVNVNILFCTNFVNAFLNTFW